MGAASFSLLLLAALLALFAPVLFSPGSLPGNYGDVYLHYYPLKHLVLEHLQTGRMPLWDPYIFAGQPLLANPQSAVFYPLSALFYFLPLPFAFTLFFFVHLFLAGLFMYLLLSKYGMGRTGSALGALSFALCSFLVYKVPAGHPVALSGYVWLPLAVLFLEELKDERRRAAPFLLGTVLSFQFLSGHTFPVYITAVFILLHFAWHRFRYWRPLLAAAAVSALFSALQLLPSFELSRLTETANWPELVRYYSLPLKNLVNVFLPDFFGNVRDGNFLYPDNPSYFFERHALYAGLLPALLALAGLYREVKDRRCFYPLLLLAGLLLALGFYTPLYRFLYAAAPGLGYLRVPARFYYLCVLALSVAAAAAWKAYLAPLRPWVKGLLLLLVAADLLSWGGKFVFAENMAAYRRKSPLSAVVNPLHRVVTAPGLPANKAQLYHQYNANGYEAILLRDFTRYVGLQERQVLSATGLARTGLTSPLSRGLAVAWEATLVEKKGTKPLARFPGGLNVYAAPSPLGRVFFPKGIKLIPNDDVYEQIAYLRQTPYSPDREILLGALPRGFPESSPGGTLLSFASASGRIDAEFLLPSAGPVVFSEMGYPGWRARAGGKDVPVVRGNKVFRTLLLPAGEYTGRNRAIFYFDPFAWRAGLYLTLASLLAALFFFLFPDSAARAAAVLGMKER